MRSYYCKTIFFIFIFISFILSMGSATAGTVIVDCNGSGDYTSIQEAIDNANSGDSIVVCNGTYTENLIVGKSVSIVSESGNPNDTTITSAVLDDDVFHVTADNVTIRGFNITRTDTSYKDEPYPDYSYSGIFLDNVKSNLIEHNVLSHNYNGIYLDCSRNNILIENTVFSNGGGISLFCSNENILANNSAFSDVEGISLFMSSNNSLAFNNISSCSEDGISFYESPNTTVTDNNIKYCNHGINIETLSENSRVIDNDVTSNNYGVYLFYAYYNIIRDNTVSDNYQSGFYIRNSLYNTLNDNIVSNNSEYGMYLQYAANNNLIYNNYFNNTINVKDECSNTWNLTQKAGANIVGGPYLGGNFWASPNGKGFSQTHADIDEDGICDEMYAIEGSNVDYLPLCINATESAPVYFEGTVYSGINLPDIIENYGIVRFDSSTGSMLKCLEFNASNFEGFSYDQDGNTSTEVLRIYDDVNITGRMIPANSMEYKTTMYMSDFNATFNGYLYDGYSCLDLFGDRYVLLSIDSPDMLVKLLKDSNETITLSEGESIDLGSGYTFELEQIDPSGERAWLVLWRYGSGYGELVDIDQNGTTWWCEWDDMASINNLITFGVHILSSNSSSITIDGLWAIDFGSALVIEHGDEFGNLTVDNVDSDSISMRNTASINLKNGTNAGIVNDLYFEIANTTNLSFQLVKGKTKGSISNSVPFASILSPSLTMMGFENTEISFEGIGFDFDGNITEYKWTSNIDGLLSDSTTFGTSDLSAGTHSINFSVKDNDGAWSDEVTTEVIVADNNPIVNITLKSQYGGEMKEVVVSGDYAYIAQAQNLVVMDITNSSNPYELGRITLPNELDKIAVYDNYVYIADNDLLIVNVSNPTSPSIEATYDLDYVFLEDIAISVNYAYVTSPNDGLAILDISNPVSPILVGSYSDNVDQVSIYGNYAYVSGYFDGFKVIDISNPASPTLVGTCDIDYNAKEMVFSDNYIYYLTYGKLIIINVSDPTSPTNVSEVETSNAEDIFISGDFAYVGDRSDGLLVIDIKDPTKPAVISTYTYVWSDTIVSLDVSNGYAYGADLNYGFVVIDISDPSSPEFVSKCNSLTHILYIDVFENYGYSVTAADGFVTIDLNNPASPKLAGVSDVINSFNGVVVSGNYAYIADYSHGLVIFNISDPNKVTSIGHCDTGSTAHDIAVSGDYAYISDYINGLVVVDISNPAAPFIVGNYHHDFSDRVYVSGNYAYLFDQNYVLTIIDVSNPELPTFIGNCTLEGYALDFAVSGNYAYVADSSNGLIIVGISDPSSPSILCNSSILAAKSLVVSDNYLYVSVDLEGLAILDISDPLSPSLVGTYNTPGPAYDVAVFGNNIYIAGWRNGLIILNTEVLSESETSQSTATSSSTSSGSGGGGGGGTTGETYENIAFKDVRTEFVEMDTVTSYGFKDDNNEVEYIQFTASRNWGKITATIECLHDTSALVDRKPDGIVYRNLNIWVGKSGFSDPDNIRDCVIGFKVSRSWLLENGIDESTIRLLHYSSGEWEELETDLVDEDDEYLHFKAITPGFSPFAIAGYPHKEVAEGTDTKMTLDSANEQEVSAEDNATESQSKSTPAFGSITCTLAIFLAGYFMVLRKRS